MIYHSLAMATAAAANDGSKRAVSAAVAETSHTYESGVRSAFGIVATYM